LSRAADKSIVSADPSEAQGLQAVTHSPRCYKMQLQSSLCCKQERGNQEKKGDSQPDTVYVWLKLGLLPTLQGDLL
jgi:hypothetical protein